MSIVAELQTAIILHHNNLSMLLMLLEGQMHTVMIIGDLPKQNDW